MPLQCPYIVVVIGLPTLGTKGPEWESWFWSMFLLRDWVQNNHVEDNLELLFRATWAAAGTNAWNLANHLRSDKDGQAGESSIQSTEADIQNWSSDSDREGGIWLNKEPFMSMHHHLSLDYMHQWKQLNTQLFTNYVCGQVKPEARFAGSRVAW
jgi:hypothetical protein